MIDDNDNDTDNDNDNDNNNDNLILYSAANHSARFTKVIKTTK